MTLWPLTAAAAVALLLGACGRATAPSPPAVAVEAPLRTVASIQDIMAGMVDPAADALWESAGSEVTAAGEKDLHPRTGAEWLTVRRHALALVEAPNLLAAPGRRVVEAGKAVEDAHVPGILGAAEIQRAIESDRPAFVRYARGLQAAGLLALAAADAKDPAALLAAGERLDAACEQCHLRYWYPKAAPRPGSKGATP